jgi:hypothetical protein
MKQSQGQSSWGYYIPKRVRARTRFALRRGHTEVTLLMPGAVWGPAALDAYRARFGNLRNSIYSMPDS